MYGIIAITALILGLVALAWNLYKYLKDDN